jgi:uncharacterized alpha-E superfamily protein
VLRQINRTSGNRAIFGNRLDKAALEEWRNRIKAQPHLYVGQKPLAPSTTPSLGEGLLEPRRSILRTFLAAGQDSFVVMPGGLTRVGAKPDSHIVSNQAGAISKDTWVLASEPEQVVTLLPQGGTAYTQLQDTLPGVAAENLFWLARYAERAETIIRLIRSIHTRRNETLQLMDPVNQAVLDMLLRGLTHVSMTWPGFTDDATLAEPLPEIIDLLTNRQRTGTLAANLDACLNAAYAVRNLVSADTRRVFNDLGDELAALSQANQADLQFLQDALDRIITALMAIAGATSESMSRELGWHFLNLGRRIERAILLTSLLRAALTSRVEPEIESLLLESVLAVSESFSLYRRRHRNRPQLEATLDLLLLDETNTRSLVYQVNAARQHLGALPGQHERPYKKEMRLVLEATTLLNLASANDLAVVDAGGRPALETLLVNLGLGLGEASNGVTATYFTHIERPYQLVEGELPRP